MRKPILLASSALLSAMAGCNNAPPPPEGYPLVLQMQNVSVTAIDELEIAITPRAVMGQPMPVFEDIEPTSLEGGAITVDVDADGVFVMNITGDYVRSHLVGGDDLNPRFEIQIWSDDPMMRMGPRVTGNVIRGDATIASGNGYMPEWPPPTDVESPNQINVPCLAAFSAECAG
jgi:hypothetical protein